VKKYIIEFNRIKKYFFILLFLLSCSPNNLVLNGVDNIELLSYNNNFYHTKTINDKDSIIMIMKYLNNREYKICKFFPKYKIKINYLDKTMIFLGNGQHIKDEHGRTYKLPYYIF
jgi:hypothetical protein